MKKPTNKSNLKVIFFKIKKEKNRSVELLFKKD